jgi:hypothetical protein
MRGGKARTGKRGGRGKQRPDQVAAPNSADNSTAPGTEFIPQQLATLKAIESLIGDLDLNGKQAAVGEELLIELQAACGELTSLNEVADGNRTNEAARRVYALAETFSGLVEGASGRQDTDRGENA